MQPLAVEVAVVGAGVDAVEAVDVDDGAVAAAAAAAEEAIDDAVADAEVVTALEFVAVTAAEESWVVDSKPECWDYEVFASEQEAEAMAVKAGLEAGVEPLAVEWKICLPPRCRCPCCAYQELWEVEAFQPSSSSPELWRVEAQAWLVGSQH